MAAGVYDFTICQGSLTVEDFFYVQNDTAPQVAVTPSAITGGITLTLGSGSFAAGDVGKIVFGNGGAAELTNVNGAATVLKDFDDTTPISPGAWTMHTPIDITAAYVASEFRTSYGSDDTIDSLTTANGRIVITDATNGRFELQWSPAEATALTGGGVYDIELSAGGDTTTTLRIIQGSMTLSLEATEV